MSFFHLNSPLEGSIKCILSCPIWSHLTSCYLILFSYPILSCVILLLKECYLLVGMKLKVQNAIIKGLKIVTKCMQSSVMVWVTVYLLFLKRSLPCPASCVLKRVIVRWIKWNEAADSGEDAALWTFFLSRCVRWGCGSCLSACFAHMGHKCSWCTDFR